MSLANLSPKKRIHAAALFFRHNPCFHRLPSRGKLIHHGNIQIAVQNQRQGSWYGCGRHDQHVRSLFLSVALILQNRPLLHTEPVLLIRNDKPQIVIGHLFANQGMGTENRLPFPCSQCLVGLPLLRCFQRPGQQAAGNAQGLQHGYGRLIVLPGKDLRWCHHGCLIAAAASQGNGTEGNGCFAAANIALHQP